MDENFDLMSVLDILEEYTGKEVDVMLRISGISISFRGELKSVPIARYYVQSKDSYSNIFFSPSNIKTIKGHKCVKFSCDPNYRGENPKTETKGIYIFLSSDIKRDMELHLKFIRRNKN